MRTNRRRPRGLTLVELVIALVVAGVAMSAIWNAWALLGRASADPLVQRQQLAIAQSLLREIELQPLPGTALAGATAGRTGFASITDYNGLVMNGITDAEGLAVPGLQAYGAQLSVSPRALEGVPSGAGWWVTVSVTGPGAPTLQLAQWRSQR
jgi:MSHA pilin protein MshD